jgi:hypothetical protein
MSDTLDLTVIIGASGDTMPEEVHVVTGQLYAGLTDSPEITGLKQVATPAPEKEIISVRDLYDYVYRSIPSGGDVAADLHRWRVKMVILLPPGVPNTSVFETSASSKP